MGKSLFHCLNPKCRAVLGQVKRGSGTFRPNVEKGEHGRMVCPKCGTVRYIAESG